MDQPEARRTFTVQPDSRVQLRVSDLPMTDDEVHHVSINKNYGKTRLYVDGIRVLRPRWFGSRVWRVRNWYRKWRFGPEMIG